MLSAVIFVLGIASFFHGFDEGVEFAGGRSYTVKFDKAVDPEQIREDLKTVFGEAPIIKTVDVKNQVNITTSFKIKETGNNVDAEVERKLYEGLQKYLPAGTSFETFETSYKQGSQTVLPTISDDLKAGATKATLFPVLISFIFSVPPVNHLS